MMHIKRNESNFTMLSSPGSCFNDDISFYDNATSKTSDSATTTTFGHGESNSSEWIQQVLYNHGVTTSDVQHAVRTLGGYSFDTLRMNTRADLASRTNKRVAEIIFEALDSQDMSLTNSMTVDSFPGSTNSSFRSSPLHDYGFDIGRLLLLDQPTDSQAFAENKDESGFSTSSRGDPGVFSHTPHSDAFTSPTITGDAAPAKPRTRSACATPRQAAPPASRRRGGRPKLSSSDTGRRSSNRSRQEPSKGRLWQFLLRLLNDRQYCPAVIRWQDKDNGVFCFVHGHQVAEMWGRWKGNAAMNYEKMTRTIRTYKNGAFAPHPTRLVYRFGKVAMAPGA